MDVPLAGSDYPRTLREFNAWFRDEEAALEYLARLRWPGGFACPVCAETRWAATPAGADPPPPRWLSQFAEAALRRVRTAWGASAGK